MENNIDTVLKEFCWLVEKDELEVVKTADSRILVYASNLLQKMIQEKRIDEAKHKLG